ncbi:hypothetical protein HDV01_006952 [Terramyces sp. JEL0728]|nr:hypothetical protein HDV01_006952 [Terramyces sp. JEL0728]
MQNRNHNQERLPQRTTKTTQKLVLLPGEDLYQPDEAQTEAEKLNKQDRSNLPRVTSYCLAESFKLEEISKYITHSHGVATKQYDECLYFYYENQVKERMFGLTQSYCKPEVLDRGEVFIFDYGVMVLWNFTETEEYSFLQHIKSFAKNLQKVEIEDFHYQYDFNCTQPRIFNDMITLKSSSLLIKLTISHGLSQSVKLSFFENIMEETIENAVPLPKMMAVYGTVKMNRSKIMKIIGNLYTLKMNVNLISNVLDTPEMFWSEPGLEGLYSAIRVYLEISQRAHLLNSRADVLTDLLSMLSDHLNSDEMTFITWIIIILILIAVVIAIAEVFVKIIRLNAGFED